VNAVADTVGDLAAADRIVVRIAYDRALWRRAMTGWWQSVVPPAPFVKRAVFWAFVWFAIGALTLFLSVLDIAPSYVAAGLIGAAFLIGIFGYLQRTRMDRFWDVIGTHWEKAGESEAVFGPEGMSLTDAVSRREFDWDAIDAVKGQRGVTVIRSGISMIAVPDGALPDGMSGKLFRDQLAAWRSA
jgi:hypothetical protein